MIGQKEGKLFPLPFPSSKDYDCVTPRKQILPTYKLEDIKDEETLVFKFFTFNPALEESGFCLLSSMNLD